MSIGILHECQVLTIGLATKCLRILSIGGITKSVHYGVTWRKEKKLELEHEDINTRKDLVVRA